jgi:hypothetical protein
MPSPKTGRKGRRCAYVSCEANSIITCPQFCRRTINRSLEQPRTFPVFLPCPTTMPPPRPWKSASVSTALCAATRPQSRSRAPAVPLCHRGVSVGCREIPIAIITHIVAIARWICTCVARLQRRRTGRSATVEACRETQLESILAYNYESTSRYGCLEKPN